VQHPSFKWHDPWTKTPQPSTYMHWGVYVGGGKEPNNLAMNEFCAVGNWTQMYDNAWGWADTACKNKFISICMTRRAWQTGIGAP
jgi:hypothetical protein